MASLLDRFGVGRQKVDFLAAPVRRNIASPWSEPGELGRVSMTEILGADIVKNLPLSREMAIAIPAVSKARNLICSSVAALPLKVIALDKTTGTAQPVGRQPSWIYRTDTNVTPYERMFWTVDDLIFYGFSMWIVERGADGQPLNASWCPRDEWQVDDGVLYVNGDPVDPRNAVLFNSPFEGLLNVGATTLRGARDIEASWVGRAKNPVPIINLKRTEDTQLTNDEVKNLVNDWAAARTNPNGAIGSTPVGIDIEVFGEIEPALMESGRNAVRTDIGSFLNVRASMLDGTMGVDSLTYSTTEGEKNSFYEFDLPFWTLPIQARLSMDDVVPRGSYTRFDRVAQYGPPAPLGPDSED
jgi:hypothetical protein